ncbi:divalent metal cation transporter [Deinococcus detaillensis]|uniref:Divalent metal cation transporter n=1 Tax=Deinococcus detaillensis TaxID=2592048 RepID=A0A553V6C6_9DEIO|nr:Nramp family divalent metal transporter [Deinococcus detaillensis]TSA88030.1 divalent metal cation transporter [Deinococcus detaillensis]
MIKAPSPVPEPERREQKHNLLNALGPGLITGASDDDPSGIATYSQVGAQFGYGLLWAMLFSYPLMATIQEISGRLGRVTGHGIAGNMRRAYAPVWLWLVTALLIVANVINLGADIGAMGEAVQLLIGGPALLYAALFAALSVLLQVFVPYTRYAQILKWLTASLLAYVATVFVVHVPWGQALRATLLPHFSGGAASIQALVAVLGTTISPYLFFWQASEEVSDMDTHVLEHPLKQAPQEAPEQFRRIRTDTFIGMAFSNLVAFFIILTAAVVLHAHGQTDIQTASQAAEALRPVAGRFAFILFAAGLVGTGLLALPVLAGSVGYALGEALSWPVGLERKPYQAKGFYVIIALSTLLGLGLVLVQIDPIKALYYSAIINGVAAAPVMLLLMLMTANERVMGEFTVKGWLRGLGWLGTGVMALAAAAMFATMRK